MQGNKAVFWLVPVLFLAFLAPPALSSTGTCASAQLLTEFSTDPATLGYATAYGGPVTAGSGGNDNALLAAYLQIRTGATFQVDNTAVRRENVWKAYVLTELDTLSSIRVSLLSQIVVNPTLDFTDAALRTQLRDIFSPAASFAGTRANLGQLQKREGSRAEVLCGVHDNAPTLGDISLAIRGTQ